MLGRHRKSILVTKVFCICYCWFYNHNHHYYNHHQPHQQLTASKLKNLCYSSNKNNSNRNVPMLDGSTMTVRVCDGERKMKETKDIRDHRQRDEATLDCIEQLWDSGQQQQHSHRYSWQHIIITNNQSINQSIKTTYIKNDQRLTKN